MLLFADVWASIGAVASVLAALAALVTLKYARDTIVEARSTRDESDRRHREIVASYERLVIATDKSSRLLLEHLGALLAETRAGQEAEEGRYVRRHNADLLLQLALQLDRVAALVKELADVAREEIITPPVVTGVSPIPLSRIPFTLARLRTSLGTLEALDGPALPKTSALSREPYSPGVAASRFLGEAGIAIDEIQRTLADEQLRQSA